jgi:transposase
MYLDEVQELILDDFDVSVSIPTISRLLDKHGWSRKVVDNRVKQRSQALRDVWQARQKLWRIDQIVALDESACNERTGDRRRGWSPVNTNCLVRYSATRNTRWSVLPAMSCDGYISYRVVQGSITQEIFEDFVLRDVLPHCTPWPGPRSILILDNGSSHTGSRLKDICAAARVKLEFLPPYSPDFNPIKQSFRVMKAWIRRHAASLSDNSENVPYIIDLAVKGCCIRQCRGYFKHSGYIE